MGVFLDDRQIDVRGGTLVAAIEAAKDAAEAGGRVIVEGLLNGVDVLGCEPSAAPTYDAASHDIRFATADPVELVRSILHGVRESLPRVRSAQSDVSDAICRGTLEPAMNRLAEALAAWGQVHQAVVGSATLLKLHPETLMVEAGPGAESTLESRVRSLAVALVEVKRTVAAEDWAGLSDAMLFDMSAQVDAWERILPSLCERLGNTSAATATPEGRFSV